MPEDSYNLSISAAATRLGVSIATVREWADAGQLPCGRTPGGQRRFRHADLDVFIERMATRAADSVA